MRVLALVMLAQLPSALFAQPAAETVAAEDVEIVPESPIKERGCVLDGENPYDPVVSGLGNNLDAGGGTYSAYVPADFQPWSPGVIILVPDGVKAEDFAFLTHVIEEVKDEYNIDDSRVYCAGHSNGCAMTLCLASSNPRLFAAIAPIGYAAVGAVDSFGGDIIPLSLYYGEYDSAVSEASPASAVEYWTTNNGVGGEKIESSSHDGLFTTTTYLTEDGAPLVEFTSAADSAHAYFPQESWRIWEDFFSHYTREGGTVYYDGVAVN